MKSREGSVTRKTRETRVRVSVFLDESECLDIRSGVPFMDHMLEAFACHGRFGLAVEGQGDVEVDPHHLVEDTGITLGRALRASLKDSPVVQRAGFFIFPMDGSLAQVAVDLCGRSTLVWKADLSGLPVGGVDPRLFRDFYKGLADGLQAAIHVRVPYLDSEHHGLEAVFKAFGRALREAVIPAGSEKVLTTKGMIDA
ncbi:MAG: imidazoleglycerol-phosphate dehydratase [Planctomycetota bacterium]|jgi:imidazoleglycerol-phosphate dehydratase